MNAPGKGNDKPSCSDDIKKDDPDVSGHENTSKKESRPPAKRRLSTTVIEISDTESDDSDVCAVNSYQASADEVKRIRGADYSSSSSTSSSSDYSSDSESPWDDDSILLHDEKKDVEAVHAELNTRANRMDDPKINNKLKSQVLLDTLSNNWKDRKDYSDSEVTLTCEPFRVCLLHELLDNPEIINNIVDDMNTLDWSRKKMDLYEFHQTADLASLTWQRSIRGIYELLKTEIMTWVSQVTGLELTSVSASCSLYGPGDHLLVHDDLLGDRRVAFILYLAPWKLNCRNSTVTRPVENGASGDQPSEKGWAASLGGALELVAKDDCGRPTEVVRSIYPRNNMLALFQVGTDSFHQVGEVLSLELPRLSINGWFHGPCAEEPSSVPIPPSPLPTPQKPHSEIVLLNEWVSSAYMSARTRVQVQQQMESASEVCLKEFLHKHRYDTILAALQEVPWERYGPADRRRCERVPEIWLQELPKGHILRELLSVFTGSAFFRLLTDCTDLALTTYQHLELKRWSPGDYALLPARERYTEARLEAIVYLGVPEGSQSGSTIYVAPEEEGSSALVTLPPVNNALNLVYCDAGAASFTKYLSRIAARGRCFYTLSCTYRENAPV